MTIEESVLLLIRFVYTNKRKDIFLFRRFYLFLCRTEVTLGVVLFLLI